MNTRSAAASLNIIPPASHIPASASPHGIDVGGLFDASPWPAWILDAETFAFLAVNRAAQIHYGYSEAEFIRMTLRDVCLPEDLPLFIEQLANLPFTFEWKAILRHRRKDGAIFYIEPARHETLFQGRRAVFTILNDVTERVRAEQSRQFLTEASGVLASSLDYEQTLQQAANLAVPRIADWCAVDMLEDDGSVRLLAVAHVDPKKVSLAYEIRRRYPLLPGETGIATVLRSGQPEIYPDIPDSRIVAGARDPRHLEMIRQVGLCSVMIVPMIARERILGAITFTLMPDTARRYRREDLTLAEGLAARAALAIDNARLYRTAQEELTGRRRVQDALRASEERFRLALTNSDITVYTQDQDLRYTWLYSGTRSEELSHLYGKTDAEFLIAEDAARLIAIKRRVMQTGIEERHIVRATYVGQEAGFYDTVFAPLQDDAGKIVGVTGTVTDITERKKAHDALARHQAEIEALNARLQRSMSETHHRVKNNLQVISALLDMQEMQHEEAVPLSEIARLRQHIEALAAIHDLLTYQAKKDAEVYDLSIKEAMEKLVSMIQSMAAGRAIVFSIEDLRMPVRQSATFTVLVNELVSNAVKHGKGTIQLAFFTRNDRALLEVCDEGPGFPEAFDAVTAAHTGLELVQTLARLDLQGEVRFENQAEGGARVVVEFPIPGSSRTAGEQ